MENKISIIEVVEENEKLSTENAELKKQLEKMTLKNNSNINLGTYHVDDRYYEKKWIYQMKEFKLRLCICSVILLSMLLTILYCSNL